MGFDIKNAGAAQIVVKDAFGSPFIEVKHEIPFSGFIEGSPISRITLAYEETASVNREACRIYVEGNPHDDVFANVTQKFAKDNSLELTSGRGSNDIRFSGIKPNQAIDTINKLINSLHDQSLVKSVSSQDIATHKDIDKIKDQFVRLLDGALEKRDTAYHEQSVETGESVLLASDATPRLGRTLPGLRADI